MLHEGKDFCLGCAFCISSVYNSACHIVGAQQIFVE